MSTLNDALHQLDGIVAGTPHVADYLAHRERYRSDVQRVLNAADKGLVLEVGSVPCHGTALLTLCGVPVVGIDIVPERAQSLIDLLSLDVRRCDIEREQLPFEDESIGTVLFAETFEHLRVDPLFVLSEIHRVMTPDGRLLLTTPNLYSAQNIARFLLGRGITDGLTEFSKLRRLGHMGHVREYSHKEMRRFLEASGFAVEHIDFAHYNFKGKRGRLARIAFALLPRCFQSFQVLIARKSGPGQRLSPLPR